MYDPPAPPLRIGSLFSGIGGLDLGLEWSGLGRTVYQVELDPFARSILSRHWPDVPRFNDVQDLDPDQLPACDILQGGFPCQDLSIANAGPGARAGLSGARSGLWAHMARIAEAQRPTWIVVENVARGWRRWLPAVRGDLRRIGYTSIPVPLEGRLVGRPHVRSRLFLLAHADGFQLRHHEQRLPWGRPGELPHGRQGLAPDYGPESRRPTQSCPPLVAHGLPRGVGRTYRALGNAVIPQCAEVIGYMIRELIEAGALTRNNRTQPAT